MTDPRIEAAARALRDAEVEGFHLATRRQVAERILAAADAVEPRRSSWGTCRECGASLDQLARLEAATEENERLRGRLDATRTALTAVTDHLERHHEDVTNYVPNCSTREALDAARRVLEETA